MKDLQDLNDLTVHDAHHITLRERKLTNLPFPRYQTTPVPVQNPPGKVNWIARRRERRSKAPDALQWLVTCCLPQTRCLTRLLYGGTSLTKTNPLGPYRRPMPRVQGGSLGQESEREEAPRAREGGDVLIRDAALHQLREEGRLVRFARHCERPGGGALPTGEGGEAAAERGEGRDSHECLAQERALFGVWGLAVSVQG